MDEARLDEIEARASAATPGPWRAGSVESEGRVWAPYAGALEGPHGERCIFLANTHFPHTPDRRFVAEARTDVPDLVVEVRRLTKELGLLRGQVSDMQTALIAARRAGARAMRAAALRDAVAAERERCAVWCDEVAAEPVMGEWDDDAEAYRRGRRAGARECAEKCRAGGV